MILARPTVVALTLVVGTTLASSQTTSPFVEAKRIASPTTTHPGDKGLVRAGDVNGDQDVDLIYSDAGNLRMFFAPGKTSAPIDLARQSNSFDLLPPQNAGDSMDIVTVNASGIVILSDYDAGVFTETTRVSALWNGAQSVTVSDVDQNGTTDLVGVHADGQAILQASHIRDATPTFSFFPVGSLILDYAVGDWTGTSDREILVLTSAGLKVFDLNGTVLTTVPFTADSGVLAGLRQPGYAYARAVIIYRTASTTYRHVVDATTSETPQVLPGITPVATHVTDIDEDGDGDHILVASSSTDVYYWPNESNGNPPGGGTPTYIMSNFATVGIGALSRYQQAPAGLRDFDNDGDLDLLQYTATTDEFVYCPNTTIDPTSELVSFNTIGPDDDLDGQVVIDANVPQGEEQLIRFEFGVTVPSKPFVEVTVWSQPLDEVFELLDSDPAPVFQGVFTVNPDGTADLTLDLGPQSVAEANAFNIEVRGVDFVAGNVESPGPTAFAAFALFEEIADAIETAHGAGMEVPDVMIDSPGGGGPQSFFGQISGRELTPTLTCTPNTPPFCLPPSPVKPAPK